MEINDKSKLATWMILLGVVFWGATFVFIKQAVNFVDVFSFLSVRFIIAGLLLCLIFCKKFKKYNREILWKGILIGSILAVAFILQTIGIKFTTASNAAFIIGLNVVIVPFIVAFLDKKIPNIKQILAIVLAIIGLGLITIKPGFSINTGDWLVALAAAVLAIHLVSVSRLVKKIDASLFSITQLLTVGVITGITGFIVNKEIVISNEYVVWQAILFCAIFASAYMYTTQAYMQRYITELKAAIIFSFEPLFAAIIAFFYLGERMTLLAIGGGIIMLFAMVVSEFKKNIVSDTRG